MQKSFVLKSTESRIEDQTSRIEDRESRDRELRIENRGIENRKSRIENGACEAGSEKNVCDKVVCGCEELCV